MNTPQANAISEPPSQGSLPAVNGLRWFQSFTTTVKNKTIATHATDNGVISPE